jgi:hypothetical protein
MKVKPLKYGILSYFEPIHSLGFAKNNRIATTIHPRHLSRQKISIKRSRFKKVGIQKS